MKKSMFAMSLFVFVAACGKKDDGKPADSKDKGSPSVKDGDKGGGDKGGGDKGGGEKKDPPKLEPAKEVSLEKMTFTAPKGWEGQYNKNLNDYPFEKYTPKPGDDINESNAVYVSNLPDDVPVGVDEYAAKLSSDDKFQDLGYKYTKIAEKTKTADGWLIKGTVAPTKPMDDDDKPHPGFVMMREIDGARIRCRAGAMRSEALVAEGIELCKSIKLK